MMKKLLLLSLCFFSLVQAGEESNPEENVKGYELPSGKNCAEKSTLKIIKNDNQKYPYSIEGNLWWSFFTGVTQGKNRHELDKQATTLYSFSNQKDAEIIFNYLSRDTSSTCYIFDVEIIKGILSDAYKKAQ